MKFFPVGHQLRVGLGLQPRLHRQRAAQGGRGAVEGQQHRVAGHVHYAALVLSAGLTEHRASCVEQFHRQSVVDGHQAGISGAIGRKDGDQAGSGVAAVGAGGVMA